MALTILFTAERSSDFKSISVQDNNTTWGVGGEPDVGDVTGITMDIYGTDKGTPLKSVAFTAGEISSFTGGSNVTFPFSDIRLFQTLYAPDNYYLAKLTVTVSTGSTVATLEAFDSYYYLYQLINQNAAGVDVTLTSFYEANRQVTGDNVALDMLKYLSSEVSVARENKWRKIYDFLAYNYDVE